MFQVLILLQLLANGNDFVATYKRYVYIFVNKMHDSRLQYHVVVTSGLFQLLCCAGPVSLT